MFACVQLAGKDDSQNPVKRGRSARLVAMEANNAADSLTNVVGGCQVSASSQDIHGGDKIDSGRLVTSTPSRPLTVQTSFPDFAVPPAGPHSGGSSTDTASEVASLIHSPGELSMSSNNDSLAEARILKSYFDEDLGDNSKVDLDSRLAEAARVLNATPGELDLLSKGDHADTADTDGTKVEQRDQKNVTRQFTAKVKTLLCSLLVTLFVNNNNNSNCCRSITCERL